MQLILNENQESNAFTFDEELNVHLLSGLKNKLSENTNKTILHKNMTHSVAYQERFLEKVQEKLKNEEKKPDFVAKEPNYYTNPAQFVQNLEWGGRHIRKDKKPYLNVQLVIYCGTELRLGLLVGCWFLSFNESGLVSCRRDHLPHYPSFRMSLATRRKDKEISQLMTHLTEYLIACNGSMEYNKELFNEAHFIKYWAELYGVWKPNKMSTLARVGFEYLDSYCKTQTLPNTLICSSDIINYSNELDFPKLCATHKVAIEQADEFSDVILRADEVQQFETLFCEYLQYNPDINCMQDIDMMLQVAKWLVIKQKNPSNIALKNQNELTYNTPMYNWPSLSTWVKEMSKKYASKALLPENTVIEQQAVVPKTVVPPPVMNPPRQIYSGVLPIQEVLAKAQHKEEGELVELRFADAQTLKQMQDELLKIGMGNGRVTNEPRKVNYLEENGNEIFLMKLSKVEYDAILQRNLPQPSGGLRSNSATQNNNKKLAEKTENPVSSNKKTVLAAKNSPSISKPMPPVASVNAAQSLRQLLAKMPKKQDQDRVQLKFATLDEVMEVQHELLSIGMGQQKIVQDDEDGKKVFLLTLSQVEYQCLMARAGFASLDTTSKDTASKPFIKESLASNNTPGGETNITELAKNISTQEALATGALGPRTLAGWTLHDVNDEGNCFYEAVVHQLEFLGHEFIKTNLSGLPMHHVLRLLVQGAEKFHDKEWAGDEEIKSVCAKLKVIVAVVDTRQPQNGYVYYYTNEQQEHLIAFNASELPRQPVIKLAYTGNHFLSVQAEAVEKKVTHTAKRTKVDNLFEKPKEQILPDDCTQLTIGDLHANMMLLLYFLVSHRIIEISAEKYQELARIYQEGAQLNKENFKQFNSIIDSLEIKNKHILIRLIGDEVADRGQNDYFIFKLLAKLQQEGVNMEILASNHGGEFLMSREKKDFSQSISIIPDQRGSLNNLQTLLNEQTLQRAQLDELIERAYLPNLKLISYSMDSENAISIYTHAPASLNKLKNNKIDDWWPDNSLSSLALFFNVAYDISSITALIKTIDDINEQFRLRIHNKTASELFEKNMPVEQFIWSRNSVKRHDTLQYGYTTSFIHGHTFTRNDPANVYNLDGKLGKALNETCGTLISLISSGSPAICLDHKQEENVSITHVVAKESSSLDEKPCQNHSQPPIEGKANASSGFFKQIESHPNLSLGQQVKQDKTQNVPTLDAHIQRLQQEVDQMILGMQPLIIEAQRARNILDGRDKPNANETTEMLHKKIEQLKVYLSTLKPYQQWLNTLKAMSKDTVISQKDYQQLKELPSFATYPYLVNYQHVASTSQRQQQPQTSMFFKPQNQNNLAYCIRKLKESISTMEQSNLILESQIRIIEVKCQEARNDPYAPPELPQLLLLEKEKVQLKQAIVAHKERISTLSEMSQGKAITMQQYQQLIIMDVFKQNEIIANYQNIISGQNIFNK